MCPFTRRSRRPSVIRHELLLTFSALRHLNLAGESAAERAVGEAWEPVPDLPCGVFAQASYVAGGSSLRMVYR